MLSGRMELEVNGARMAVDEYGAGAPVVLVHGLGTTATDLWKNVTAELASDFRVVAYDLRGSGSSQVAPGPYPIELLAGDLAALIDALGLDRVAIVGHSLGGGIALQYAAAHPERTRAVVGVAAVAEPPKPRKQAMRERADAVETNGMAAVAEDVAADGIAPSFREAHPEELQELISLLASNSPEGYAAQCRTLATMSAPDLARISAPVLLVCGELDVPSPPSMNRDVAARLPDAEVVVIPDCAHIIPWEKPAELLAAARPFLVRTS